MKGQVNILVLGDDTREGKGNKARLGQRRRLGHHDPDPPLRGPDLRLRRLDPARHHRRPARVHQEGRGRRTGAEGRDVERRLHGRRAGVHGQAVREA
ncbi:hypothetical protein [Nocardioides convexus]|uniref:hypothetical protein n=1 Tax=Nocardioides convexus TaxID=2712224 RepID=UPI002418479D|nr:hypothetical protein [Nocardioides convexus]